MQDMIKYEINPFNGVLSQVWSSLNLFISTGFKSSEFISIRNNLYNGPYTIATCLIPLEIVTEKLVKRLVRTSNIDNNSSYFSISNANELHISLSTESLPNSSIGSGSIGRFTSLGISLLLDLLLYEGGRYQNEVLSLNDTQIYEKIKSILISELLNYKLYLRENQLLFQEALTQPSEIFTTLFKMNLEFMDNQIKNIALNYTVLKMFKEDEIKSQIEDITGISSIKSRLNEFHALSTNCTKAGLLIYKVISGEINILTFNSEYSKFLLRIAKDKLICHYSNEVYLVLDKLLNDPEVLDSVILHKVNKEINFLRFILFGMKLKARDLINKAISEINSFANNKIGKDSSDSDSIDKLLNPIISFI